MLDNSNGIVSWRKELSDRGTEDWCQLVGQLPIAALWPVSLRNLGLMGHMDPFYSCNPIFDRLCVLFGLISKLNQRQSIMSELHAHNSGRQNSNKLFAIWGQPMHSVTIRLFREVFRFSRHQKKDIPKRKKKSYVEFSSPPYFIIIHCQG